MPLYIFIFHANGLPKERVEQEFVSDDEALQAARHLSSHCDIDIWAGDKVIAEVPERVADGRHHHSERREDAPRGGVAERLPRRTRMAA